MLFWARFLGPDLAPKKEVESSSACAVGAAVTLGAAEVTGAIEVDFFLPSMMSICWAKVKFKANLDVMCCE
jgi:hypothetical protein